MIVVLDASAAVKLVLDETGSDQVRRLGLIPEDGIHLLPAGLG